MQSYFQIPVNFQRYFARLNGILHWNLFFALFIYFGFNLTAKECCAYDLSSTVYPAIYTPPYQEIIISSTVYLNCVCYTQTRLYDGYPTLTIKFNPPAEQTSSYETAGTSSQASFNFGALLQPGTYEVTISATSNCHCCHNGKPINNGYHSCNIINPFNFNFTPFTIYAPNPDYPPPQSPQTQTVQQSNSQSLRSKKTRCFLNLIRFDNIITFSPPVKGTPKHYCIFRDAALQDKIATISAKKRKLRFRDKNINLKKELVQLQREQLYMSTGSAKEVRNTV